MDSGFAAATQGGALAKMLRRRIAVAATVAAVVTARALMPLLAAAARMDWGCIFNIIEKTKSKILKLLAMR